MENVTENVDLAQETPPSKMNRFIQFPLTRLIIALVTVTGAMFITNWILITEKVVRISRAPVKVYLLP